MFRPAALLVALLLPSVVCAQTKPGPPGPYVIDLHGAMVAVPNAGEFYPTLPVGAIIPGRAFGFDVGAHVLGPHLGGSRVGIGANTVVVRGHVGPPDVTATITAIAPQVSFNFGTSDGWSYLGGGYGIGKVSTRVAESSDATAGTGTGGTGTVGTLNFGGGVRWFLKSRLAGGFDVRFYRFGASNARGTPATMRVALSVGVSVR